MRRAERDAQRQVLVDAYHAARERVRRERTVEAAEAVGRWLARLVVYDEEQEATA